MNILKRLHHRPPFLLVDKVIEHNANLLTTTITPTGEEFFLKGIKA